MELGPTELLSVTGPRCCFCGSLVKQLLPCPFGGGWKHIQFLKCYSVFDSLFSDRERGGKKTFLPNSD